MVTIGCAFCRAEHQLEITERTVELTCKACGSVFAVVVTTHRVWRAPRPEPPEPLRIVEPCEVVEARNEAVALQLLAEDGCTCDARKNDWKSKLSAGLRHDGLISGWKRNGRTLPPIHRHDCPAAAKRRKKK